MHENEQHRARLQMLSGDLTRLARDDELGDNNKRTEARFRSIQTLREEIRHAADKGDQKRHDVAARLLWLVAVERIPAHDDLEATLRRAAEWLYVRAIDRGLTDESFTSLREKLRILPQLEPEKLTEIDRRGDVEKSGPLTAVAADGTQLTADVDFATRIMDDVLNLLGPPPEGSRGAVTIAPRGG